LVVRQGDGKGKEAKGATEENGLPGRCCRFNLIVNGRQADFMAEMLYPLRSAEMPVDFIRNGNFVRRIYGKAVTLKKRGIFQVAQKTFRL
jgi:hypothetical protein